MNDAAFAAVPAPVVQYADGTVLLSCCVKVNVVPSALVAVNVVPLRSMPATASPFAANADLIFAQRCSSPAVSRNLARRAPYDATMVSISELAMLAIVKISPRGSHALPFQATFMPAPP